MGSITLALSPSDKRFRVLAVIIALLSTAAGISLWQLKQRGPEPALESLLVLPEPRTLAAFDLVDENGQAFTLERLRGHWSLLFFGFTHCPDICPSALYDLAQVYQSATTANPAGSPLQVVFVSVDPERDTPERLAEYVRYFDPDFHGATGSPAQLNALAMQIGVAFRVEPHEPGASGYSVDHSASILLTDPNGRLYGVFAAPHTTEAMARDLLAIMN